LEKYKWNKAEEFESLDCLKLDELLGFRELGIKMATYDDGIMINGKFMARHGELVRKYSGWTAKAHYEKHGGNGIVGHSHRGGHYTTRNRFGVWGWAENFCMCDLDPDYTPHPDWQHGFTVQTWFGEHQYILEQIPIINYRFLYGGGKLFD